jgi:hypothetical protein
VGLVHIIRVDLQKKPNTHSPFLFPTLCQLNNYP